MLKVKYCTKNNILNIELSFDSISVNEVPYDYNLSSQLCKSGCKNFNKKYSCPPHSPSFGSIIKNRYTLSIFLVKIYTTDLTRKYITLKMINSVARSIQRSYFTFINNNSEELKNYFLLGNGSCRACRKCAYIKNEKCKKPHEIIVSLEATGINVDKLVEEVFSLKLEWYKLFNNSFPKFQCVVGGIVCNNYLSFYELFIRWYEEIFLANSKVKQLDYEYII